MALENKMGLEIYAIEINSKHPNDRLGKFRNGWQPFAAIFCSLKSSYDLLKSCASYLSNPILNVPNITFTEKQSESEPHLK